MHDWKQQNNKRVWEKLGKEQQQAAIATTKERENGQRKAVAEIPISDFQFPFILFFLGAENNNSNNNIIKKLVSVRVCVFLGKIPRAFPILQVLCCS